jgi:hypothetical protein
MTAPIDSFSQVLAWMDQYAGFLPTGLRPRLSGKELRWMR